MAKNSSPSRAPKTGAQLRDNRRSAEQGVNTAENPSHAHLNIAAITAIIKSVAQLECPQSLAMN